MYMAHDAYQINKDKLVWRKNGELIVILSMLNGQYFSLNGSASFLWELMESGISSVESLSEKLSELYDVSQPEALKDTKSLLRDLEKSRLLIAATKNGKRR